MVSFTGAGLERGSSGMAKHCPGFVTWSDGLLGLVLGFGTGGGREFILMVGFSSAFSIFVSISFSTYSLLGLGWLIEMLERA